jgi:separase
VVSVHSQRFSVVSDGQYSPTLVANIWDVTDRDIDKFAQSTFDKLRVTRKDSDRWNDESEISVVAAVAQSRDSCKLKYLTGAAPVVYGIPFYL